MSPGECIALRIVGGWCFVLMLVFFTGYVYAGHIEALIAGWVFGSVGVVCLVLADKGR